MLRPMTLLSDAHGFMLCKGSFFGHQSIFGAIRCIEESGVGTEFDIGVVSDLHPRLNEVCTAVSRPTRTRLPRTTRGRNKRIGGQGIGDGTNYEEQGRHCKYHTWQQPGHSRYSLRECPRRHHINGQAQHTMDYGEERVAIGTKTEVAITIGRLLSEVPS